MFNQLLTIAYNSQEHLSHPLSSFTYAAFSHPLPDLVQL